MGKIERGSVVRVPFGGRKVRGIVMELAEHAQPPDGLHDVLGAVFEVPLVPRPLDQLFVWLSRRYLVPLGKALDRGIPPRVRIGPIKPEQATARAASAPMLEGYDGGSGLADALRTEDAGAWCLQVKAGEDRAALIAEMVSLAAGPALVCVPEVAHGSAVLEGLTARWPDAARVDSSVDDMDRSRAWAALAAGATLGIGGRGAVLAPLPDLKLVVIDEEQHRTYKEDRAPRFDTRRVALERARLQDAVCVLMSGSPSIEASAAGGSDRFVAPPRAARRAARPIVEVIEPETGRWLSHALHMRINKTLEAGQRVGLLVPTRGYARALWCASCRRSVRCPRCEAGVFFDKEAGAIRCVRCGFRGAEPSACPSCGRPELRYVGAGSERMGEQLTKAFPRAKVVRVDASNVDWARAPEDVDIYVTTWIGTKEALRPEVALVGVIDADSLLNRPDFRAAETTYHALAEMAEWAGPADREGRLMLQTAQGQHHSIQAVVRADHRYFLERELALRAELGYPPFSELIKVSVGGPDARGVLDTVTAAATSLGAIVLGPVSVAMPRPDEPGGRAQEILIKCRDALEVAGALRGILPTVSPAIRWRVDVDPR